MSGYFQGRLHTMLSMAMVRVGFPPCCCVRVLPRPPEYCSRPGTIAIGQNRSCDRSRIRLGGYFCCRSGMIAIRPERWKRQQNRQNWSENSRNSSELIGSRKLGGLGKALASARGSEGFLKVWAPAFLSVLQVVLGAQGLRGGLRGVPAKTSRFRVCPL